MILRALSSFWTSCAPQMANHLWQSTLFVLLAAILAFALRKNQAQVRYWVWLTASLKFLLPFSLLIALGSHLAKPRPSTPAQAVVYSAVEDFSQPFAGEQMPVLYHQPPTAAPASPLHLLPAIVVAVWLVGIIVILLRGLIGWVRISRMIRNAASVDQGPEVNALRRLESSLDVRKPIRLVLSPDWMEPGIFGIFRPVLIWPEGISKHLDDRHIEAILAHEVCHARRHDNFTAVLHMLVEAVFWFHPLVWWMGARLEEERERACDEEVSLLCSQPHIYAESILRVCKFCSESPLACVSGITGADLKKRIVQIMTDRVVRKLDLGRKLLLLAVGLAVVAVPIVLGQAKAAQRLAYALLQSAPAPLRTVAHAMITEEQTPSAGGIGGTAGMQDFTQAGQVPSFEAVSIRPCQDPREHMVAGPGAMYPPRGTSTPGKLRTGCYPLLDDNGMGLIRGAFADTFTPINGGPSWMHSAFYEIDAIADGSPSVKVMMGPMMQALLEQRFHLKIHHQTAEGAVYYLSVARGGSKLHSFAAGSCTLHTSFPPPPLPQGQEYCEALIGGGSPARVEDRGVTLDYFAKQLLGALDRPVINRTGLGGRFDIQVEFSREGTRMAGRALAPTADDSSAASDLSGPPSIFTVLQEKLGLKLESGKGPVDAIVIDHIEKPTIDDAEVAESSRAQPQNAAAPSPRYEYEAATIKPSQGPGPYKKIGLWAAPDGFSAWFITPQQIISIAYGIKSFQISGGPSWLPSDRFDIEAKMDAATADALKKLSPDQRTLAQQQMLQALLANRFQLTVHRETKELTTYTLVVAKGGPKLQQAKPGDTYPNGFTYPDGTHAGAGSMSGSQVNGNLTAQAVPIARLLLELTQMLGHPVSDQTGLKGVYDFKLRFTPDDRLQPPSGSPPDLRFPPPPADSNAPSLFDALQEQLGLKLESGKGPVEVIVIDRIERPSEN